MRDDAMDESGLILGRITDTDIAMMRARIGTPNPTLRKGYLTTPWNTVCSADAIRQLAECTGDMNPLYNDEDHARASRWGAPVAQPGFEWSTGYDRNPIVSEDLYRRTHKALRGVQLYHSGAEYVYYAPITEGTRLYKSEVLANVTEKESRFANRSVLVDNETCWWDAEDRVHVTSNRWFVHAERRNLSAEEKAEKRAKPKVELGHYNDDAIAEIEAAYDAEYIRGTDTLYLEDVTIGQELPRMVKGPLTITDMINIHMGAGWLTYGNPPYRLAYENRKRLRGFYSRNESNYWDTVQRVHWDPELARKVGVPHVYDIGPMRFFMICHYVSNWAGDDAFVHRIRYELRNFNYMGDVTWLTARIADARVDDKLGPLVELEITGTNQRGETNINAKATILVASRQTGLAKLPEPPAVTPHRRLEA
ncbi:MaoC family dehydratase N-terminal domain-containing protein [Paracoccus sp. J55]|uniref:FAS1-like dehydratase domain-containing protein n=1 Tax=Paracoccus sp. J55 TaxID=935849 RepID=UPI0004AEE291|nr:MaoC family dehydratase N-terminal domain-containing protein [Paracoccus sp. J55]